MLAQLRERGLLKARGRQRTDSTHVLAAVRTVNRLESVGETLRAALNALATERHGGRQAARLDRPGVSRSIRSVVCAVDAPGGAGADRAREWGVADPVGGRPLSAGLGLYRPAADAAGH